jgi:topoisomerase IV subunit A
MNFVEPVMRQNFLEYASYVIIDRAIPDIRDGCKPVQRRILHTLSEVDDGRFHKVANVIGETMKLHPHGDASIGDALVVLANRGYFIERQGNFGNIITGHPPAAARYIECRLTPLARETLFNKNLTEWRPSYDGRKKEPAFLPAKLPVILMLGTEGIAVGMSTRILPHNFTELLRAQVKILLGEKIELYPDFPQGGLMDVSEYDAGHGKIRVRARLESSRDKKEIIIREIPFSTTTESLISSMEAAAQKGKVKISSIEDRTADKVEIVLHLSRGVYADEVIPQLYAYTDCEVSISSSMVVIRDRRPVAMTPGELLEILTGRLQDQIGQELSWELEQLEEKRHYLTLEQIFIENRVYKRIEKANTREKVVAEVYAGMKPFEDLFIREMTDEDVDRLLEIRIRRISAYDIEKNRKDLDDIVRAIGETKEKLWALKQTTIDYLDSLIERYGKDYPRRTEITTFDAVDKREVARQNLKLSFDPQTGFFGTDVRGSQFQMTVSEFDKILAVSSDGSYRIFSPPDKKLLPPKVLHIGVFDEKDGQELTVLYRDEDRNPFAKLVHIRGFIHDKEYELIKGRKGKIDRLIPGRSDKTVYIEFVPIKRARVHEATFDLSTLDPCGVSARGTRMAPKPAAKVKLI